MREAENLQVEAETEKIKREINKKLSMSSWISAAYRQKGRAKG